MLEFRENNRIKEKFSVIQETLTPKEMSLFIDLKKKCFERNGDFYLDKKFFPFPDEVEDFLEFLSSEGVLQKLGPSENGVGGFIWKLRSSVFDELSAYVSVLGATEAASDFQKESVDEIFENLEYEELDYLLRIPELWFFEGSVPKLDIHKNVFGTTLSLRQKRMIFQSLLNMGIVEKGPNPDIVMVSYSKYFDLWSKLFEIDKNSSSEKFVDLERNEGIIFQSLLCFFDTYVFKQKNSILKEYFPQFMKTQIKNKYSWNIKKENFFLLLLENLIERGFFREYDSVLGTVVECTPQAYRYLGKTVPEELSQKYLLLEQEKQKAKEDEERARLRAQRDAFLKSKKIESFIAGPRIETPFVTSQEFFPSEDIGEESVEEPVDETSVSQAPVTESSHPVRRDTAPDKKNSPRSVSQKFDTEKKEKITISVVEQHKKALEKMLAKEKEKTAHELYAHQTPMVEDFLEYLKEVVEFRESSKMQEQESSEKEKIDMTYARIVSAPRTGKTVVAADIIRRTGLRSVFFVPSINLVAQAKIDLEVLLPGKKIAMYSGEYLEDIADADVIVATYQKGVRDLKKEQELPKEIRSASLIFADEGHEATTKGRMDLLSECHEDALKIALSGTPDYNEERTLEKYFPTLIHELSMREAIEMGILAPFRYSTYVVAVDASRVEIKAGQYDETQMGSIMSELPFFKFCEALRYSSGNKNTPALLVCKTKTQAFALEKYLNQSRGEHSGGVGVVVDKTENRGDILEQYEAGTINTLITVRALLRGWDSPRCKLLIDMAPGRSPVLAGQKYTRPLTKNGEEEATLYTLLPINLPLEPILPSDVLMSYEMDLSDVPVQKQKQYEAGHGGTSKSAEESEFLPDNIDGVSIKLKVRNQEYGGLGSKKFDSHDKNLIRSVIESGIQFEEGEKDTKEIRHKKRVEILKSYFSFRNTLFSHGKFQGYGRTFLFLCGIKGFDEYWNFVMKLFPEEAGTLFLYGQNWNINLEKGLKDQLNLDSPIASDVEKMLSLIPKRLLTPEELGTFAKTFLGYEEISDFDDIFLKKKVQKVFLNLSSRERNVLYRRFIKGETLEEVGKYYDLQKERIRTIEAQALRKMRQHLNSIRDIKSFMED